MNVGCLGLIVVVALLWGGGQGIYTALKNRNPLVISVEDYLAQRPQAEWVTLQNAERNLLESAYSEKYGKIKEVFIPIRPVGSLDTEPVHILLSTKDPKVIQSLGDLKNTEQNQGNIFASLAKHRDQLFVKEDVSGLIRFGINADDKTKEKLSKLKLKLTKDFVILNEGEAPNLGLGVTLFGLGLMGAWFMARRSMKSPPPLPRQIPPRFPQ